MGEVLSNCSVKKLGLQLEQEIRCTQCGYPHVLQINTHMHTDTYTCMQAGTHTHRQRIGCKAGIKAVSPREGPVQEGEGGYFWQGMGK